MRKQHTGLKFNGDHCLLTFHVCSDAMEICLKVGAKAAAGAFSVGPPCLTIALVSVYCANNSFVVFLTALVQYSERKCKSPD